MGYRRSTKSRRLAPGALAGLSALAFAAAIAIRELLTLGTANAAQVMSVVPVGKPAAGAPARTGYLVTYRHEGREGVVRMNYDPGAHLPVADGDILIGPPVVRENANPVRVAMDQIGVEPDPIRIDRAKPLIRIEEPITPAWQ